MGRKCPKNTIELDNNNICVDKITCNTDNCSKCHNKIKCEKCIHGLFLHENKCLEKCPIGTRANRIDFTCQNKSSFSFFMIYPSTNSCKNKCGLNNLEEDKDCSCDVNCLRNGNCCDDFEKACPLELEKEKCQLCKNCIKGRCKSCKENSEFYFNDC